MLTKPIHSKGQLNCEKLIELAIEEIDECNKSDSLKLLAIRALKFKNLKDSVASIEAMKVLNKKLVSFEKKELDWLNSDDEKSRILKKKDEIIIKLEKRPTKIKVFGAYLNGGIIGVFLTFAYILIF